MTRSAREIAIYLYEQVASPGPTETIVLIEAPHFVAGVIAEGGRVTEAAPIIGYMVGWDGQQLATYCKGNGWTWQRVATKGARR